MHVRKVERDSGAMRWRATVTTAEGKRRSKNFTLKKEADAWARANDHAAASGSDVMTVADLARDHNRWFGGLVAAGERAQITLDGYEGHLRKHLKADADVANCKLRDLTAPLVQTFLDRLLTRTGSAETVRRLKRSLSAWCEHGVRSGWLKLNPTDACKVVEKRRRRAAARIYIPAKPDLTALLRAAAEGPSAIRDTAVIHVLMFGGLRISEALGLADEAAELRRPTRDGMGAGGILRVVERLCTRHVTLGGVKSDDGLRNVPIGPACTAAIRAWRVARGPALASRRDDGQMIEGRLFPADAGRSYGALWAYADFNRLCWAPLMIRAGLGRLEADKKGVQRAKVDFGPHTLRHVYASIQIENGVTPKRLQTLLGHSTLAMTMDLYGHLWADPVGDQAMTEAAERTIPRAAP